MDGAIFLVLLNLALCCFLLPQLFLTGVQANIQKLIARTKHIIILIFILIFGF